MLGLCSKWLEVADYIDGYDVAVITEIKLDKMVTSDSIMRRSYSLNRNDRSSNGGSIASYIRNSLKPITLFDLQEEAKTKNIEMTLDMITADSTNKTNSKFIIIGVYRPPNTDVGWFTKFDSIVALATALAPVCFMGDVNADLLKPTAPLGKQLLHSLEAAEVRIEQKLFQHASVRRMLPGILLLPSLKTSPLKGTLLGH